MASRSVEKGNAALAQIRQEAGKQGLPGSLSLITLDVTDEGSVAAAVQQVEREFGRLDVLVNNAGIVSTAANVKTRFEETFRANVVGPVLVTSAFEGLLLKSEKPYLMHVGSSLGSLTLMSDPQWGYYQVSSPAYAASKAALNVVMVEDFKRLGKRGVKVFTVCPGLVRSNLRGTSEEQVSAGGKAVDATVSGEFILSIMEGKRDADVGKFVHKEGVWPW